MIDLVPTLLNFIGTIIIAKGLLISDKEALELGVSRWGGTEEQNMELPAVKDRIKQRKHAKIGLAFLGAGLVLELVLRLV